MTCTVPCGTVAVRAVDGMTQRGTHAHCVQMECAVVLSGHTEAIWLECAHCSRRPNGAALNGIRPLGGTRVGFTITLCKV
eukprot:364644-Chlamydomonas_euryale.AAC.22